MTPTVTSVSCLAGDYVFIGEWQVNACSAQLNPEARVRGISIDALGRVAVSEAGNNCIQLFTSLGVKTNQWGEWGSMENGTSYPAGVAWAENGYVYNTTQNPPVGKIQWFDPSIPIGPAIGESYITSADLSAAYLTADQSGHVYAGSVSAPTGQWYVQQYDLAGVFTGIEWGATPGTGSIVGDIYGIAAHPSGFVYLVDNSAILKKYDLTGGLVDSWTIRMSDDKEVQGQAVAVDPIGNIYVVAYGEVIKYSPTGLVLARFGNGQGTGPGQFMVPKGAAVNPVNGWVYVTNNGWESSERVVVYAPCGTPPW